MRQLRLATAVLMAAILADGAAARTRPPGAPLLINESRSLPRGLYVRTSAPLGAGRIVAVTPPSAGRCYLQRLGAHPDALLLKRVVMTGDRPVCGRAGRLTWRGGSVVALQQDRQGRILPTWRGCRRLAQDEVLVLGDTPASFDSRYFGPVRTSAITGIYREVLRW